MTRENRKALVAHRLEQADESLNAARLLLKDGFLRSAVNRAYYCMFYAILALLAAEKKETSKHSGAIALFDRDYVKPGIFPKELSRAVHEAFDLRQRADYSAEYTPSAGRNRGTDRRRCRVCAAGENAAGTRGVAMTRTEAESAARQSLAQRWVSYAVGIVLGRFQPGVDGALGRGRFTRDVADKLRALADPDGVMVIDEGHPDDLAARVLDALRIMLGEEAAREVVREATGTRRRSGRRAAPLLRRPVLQGTRQTVPQTPGVLAAAIAQEKIRRLRLSRTTHQGHPLPYPRRPVRRLENETARRPHCRAAQQA
ncbi:MAG: hypothetical protein KatS3mg109_0265 [Pirellulaceae bacterium]|nr:MAG: hypothetical protein KatS3mg109_0265 [Pirellulaceae bacterium]